MALALLESSCLDGKSLFHRVFLWTSFSFSKDDKNREWVGCSCSFGTSLLRKRLHYCFCSTAPEPDRWGWDHHQGLSRPQGKSHCTPSWLPTPHFPLTAQHFYPGEIRLEENLKTNLKRGRRRTMDPRDQRHWIELCRRCHLVCLGKVIFKVGGYIVSPKSCV